MAMADYAVLFVADTVNAGGVKIIAPELKGVE
jgi:hypothetical protein